MIRFRPAAARELAADVRFYRRQYTGRGDRLADAVDQTLRRIEKAPLSFPVLQEPEIRSVDVLAVAHAKRRPQYWKRRLRQR